MRVHPALSKAGFRLSLFHIFFQGCKIKTTLAEARPTGLGEFTPHQAKLSLTFAADPQRNM
jgi:hypothetical protein